MGDLKYEVVAARPIGAGEHPRPYSHREIAAIMTFRGMPMSQARVWQLEQRALAKLARNSALREFAGATSAAGEHRDADV